MLSKTVDVVCKNLSYNTNHEVIIKQPRVFLSVLPILTLKADEISYKSKLDNTILKIDKFNLKLRLLPLISGNVHVNDINANGLVLTTSLKDEVKLDKDFFVKLETSKIHFDRIRIKNFETTIYQKDVKEPIIYNGNDFVFQQKNRSNRLKLNSELKVGKKKSSANINLYLPKNNDIKKTIFDVDVSNIDISPFRIYFKNYLPQDLVDLKGFVDIHADKDNLVTELTNCEILMADSSKSMTLPPKMVINSNFEIKRHYIKIHNANIDSDNIHLLIKGKILDYFGKAMPTLDLNFSINNSKVEDFIKLLPAFNVEDINTYKLKKYNFYGDVLGNLTVKGRLPEPEFNGNIFINNGILMQPIPNTSKGATIKLSFTGKHLNVDVNVPAGFSEKVTVNGGVELYNLKYVNLRVISTQNVDLAVAKNKIDPIHEILNFEVGPVPILEVQGKGNIDITVKGNRKNPHVWGDFNAKDATVRLNDMPDLVLRNSDAVLTFNDESAYFTNKTGTVNNQKFNIDGTCTMQGKFDFNVSLENQPAQMMYDSVKMSKLLPDMKKMLPKIDKIDGLVDVGLKIYGSLKSIEDLEFNKNTFIKGEVNLKDNNINLYDMNSEKTNGVIKFSTSSADVDIIATTSKSPLSIKAKIKDEVADLVLNIPRFNPNFLINDTGSRQYLPYVSVNAKYKGKINNIEYNKLNLVSKVIESPANSKLKCLAGEISIANGRTIIKNLKGYINNPQSLFNVDLKINNTFSSNVDVSGFINVKTPDVQVLNELFVSDILPKSIKNYLKDYEFKKGALNCDLKIVNNKIFTNNDLSGISLVYIPLDLPINVMNGNLIIRNNVLRFNKINILADKMPILVDGEIRDIYSKPNFNIYINSKPQQEFIDKYINKKQVYPIKIKGDIVCWARLRGVKDDYDIKSNVNLTKESSIYHYGATIGDNENAILLDLDSRVTNGNLYRIKEFSYDKLIESQNGKQTRLNLLKCFGGMEVSNDTMNFKDLRIKTSNPTDARIFNIIFRKPNIKKGLFTSDLKLNGQVGTNLKALGDFHIFETNIPFFDTMMKNITFIFREKTVDITSKGDVLGNDFVFEGILKNKLTAPYIVEKANIYTKRLDLDSFVNKMKISLMEDTTDLDALNGIDLKAFILNDVKLKADIFELRNIHASNVDALLSLNEKGVLSVNDFGFNIAEGMLNGTYKYNLNNNEVKLDLNAHNINANDITYALFDLNNQIYGDLTGKMTLACNGTDYEHCMQTLNGNALFDVKNGRMPKLGSLEYLLKAGNLVKGGITGLSINSVIDLITPLKTGEFSDIAGSIRIKDGIARNIEIITEGKDLSLYVGGTYNFSSSNADMQVLGILSRKISTMFGPVGNLSINTLFNVIPGIDLSKNSEVLDKINKIPGLELSSKQFRKFIAEIKGNINGDNYVKSFSWIN